MRSLLIWMSGADPEILEKCSTGERIKYHGLGGAVLTTSAMAALSCTFAMHMAMRLPVVVAAVIGLGWGFAIMNLDRWLISGTQRRSRLRHNLLLALPRLLLGLLVGLVVSTPLTLRIFQDEINAQLSVMQREAQDRFARELAADNRFAGMPELAERIDSLQGQLDAGLDVSKEPAVARLLSDYQRVDREYQKAAREVICEEDGTCGTRTPGIGRAYRLKKQNRDRLARDRAAKREELTAAQRTAVLARTASLAQVRTDLREARAELTELTAAKQRVEADFAAAKRNDRGLLARMNALGELTDEDGTLALAHLTLILFLTAFEVLPVLFKLLLNLAKPTLYDRIRDKAEDVTYQLAVADYDHHQQLADQENQSRLKAELAAVDDFVQQVVRVQRDVADELIGQWAAGQLRAARSHPDRFLAATGGAGTGRADDDTLVLTAQPDPVYRSANSAPDHQGARWVGQVPAPRSAPAGH